MKPDTHWHCLTFALTQQNSDIIHLKRQKQYDVMYDDSARLLVAAVVNEKRSTHPQGCSELSLCVVHTVHGNTVEPLTRHTFISHTYRNIEKVLAPLLPTDGTMLSKTAELNII